MGVFVAVLGLIIGSFLNVVIGRLRSGEKGWRSRSWCPNCHTILKPSELIPLISFVFLRGKCRTCRKPISWQYPAVEAATAVLFLIAYGSHGGMAGMFGGQALPFVRDLVFISGLMVVFVIDLLDMTVFDSVTLPMLAFALAANLALGVSWKSLLIGSAVGAAFFLLQYVLSKGAWIGGGDVRIGAMAGAMVGFPGVLGVLLAAYVAGAVFALVLLAFKKTTWKSQLAFGTFLSAATVLVMFFGSGIWRWYAGLASF